MADDILGSVHFEIESLIQGRQTFDPRLYEAILLLNGQIEKITQGLSPLVRKSTVTGGGVSELPAPDGFTCFSANITLRFTWNPVTYASLYEVRRGSDWETGHFLFRTMGLSANIDPLLYGPYTFLIKTVDQEGNYSAGYNVTTFIVPIIAAPTITVSVIDNNVLLYWTEPETTFKIDYYVVQKVGIDTTAGKVSGTFTSIFEVVAGTYIYAVWAVDVAGNVGAIGQVEVSVSTPPDYALQDSRISGLNGTRNNVIRMTPRPSLLACWMSQTWEEHYRVFNNWMRPQEQINAGYPIYIQPTAVTGWYDEYLDYGVVINNTIVTITWNTIFHTPAYSVNVLVSMRVSNDGIVWSDWTTGASQYFKEIRFLNFHLDFTSENDHAFIELYNLTISLNVKRENDGGQIFANAGDAGGTVVTFNKPFKDIESITCTAQSAIEPYVTIFDFTDVPNPTHFAVYVFDSMGARISRQVDWKARGIV